MMMVVIDCSRLSLFPLAVAWMIQHILIKLHPLILLVGWRPLDPLLWNYSARIVRLRYVEGLGFVGCFLAVLLRLNRY